MRKDGWKMGILEVFCMLLALLAAFLFGYWERLRAL